MQVKRKRRSPGKGRRSEQRDTAPPVAGGCTLAQYAEAKQLPVTFLQSLGLQDVRYHGLPAVRIPYFDRSRAEIAVRYRLALEGDNRFRWKSGTKPQLYGQDRLDEPRTAGYVVVVEGESDVHTLWFHGIPAVGIPGANSWRDERDACHLEGIPKICAVVEPDRGGETVKGWLTTSSIRHRVQLLSLGEHKDPSEMYLADPEHFRDRFQAAKERAVPWAQVAAVEREAGRRELWVRCETLARSPSILDRFYKALATAGLVGEKRAVKLLYLIVSSRLLEQPVSAKVGGPSAVGKSYIVDRVLPFFPPSAFYVLSGMSERALAYSQEPLSHRILVLYEAIALQSDFASYLVRSLLSEGRVRYEFVEKTKDGLRARVIEREGPTGLLVTTTAIRLHPENETRLFSIPTTDTTEQTGAIMLSVAKDAETKEGDDSLNLSEWHALQDWLASGDQGVVIPYASALAKKIPPVAVRLRRDFKAILTLIRTHALLHQATRKRDVQERIIADIDDYAVVRELVADLVGEGLEATVSPAVRETVDALSNLGPAKDVSVAEVAKELELDRSAASRRVKKALNLGYLKNLEDRQGKPARLVLGDPMPNDEPILPQPEALTGHCCTVARETGGITPPSPLIPQNGRCWKFDTRGASRGTAHAGRAIGRSGQSASN